MKRSKITGVVVGILVLTIAISGGAFAWFAGALDNLGSGSGNAAKLNLTTSENNSAKLQFDKVLPGEEVIFPEGAEVEFVGNRGGIVEFAFETYDDTSDTKVYLKANLTTKEKAAITALPADYKVDATGRYYMTAKRVKEIMEITVGNSGGGTTLKATYGDGTTVDLTFLKDTATGKIYTYIPEKAIGKPEATVNFVGANGVKVHFTGELGGSFKGSADRQFEQEAEFGKEGSAGGLIIKAVQPTKEAVIDYLGAAAETFLTANLGGFGHPMQDSWHYKG